jgi:Flp pilus assembly protein TadD
LGGLARALALAGRGEEARAVVERLAGEKPDDPNYLGHLGVPAAGRGDRAGAQRVSAQLDALTQPYLRGRHTLWRVRIAAALGERERAVALLRDALQQGQGYNALFHTVVDFEPLRDYAPFRELLRPKG